MFRGTFFHNVDDKGRIAIPRKFRDALATLQGNTNIVITRAYNRAERCLDIYPLSEWKDLEERVRAKGQFNKSIKRFKRLYVHPAQDLTLDSQGRIVIPPDLRAEIGLDGDEGREAAFTGDLEKFLLWAKPDWEVMRKNDVEASEESDDLDDLDL